MGLDVMVYHRQTPCLECTIDFTDFDANAIKRGELSATAKNTSFIALFGPAAKDIAGNEVVAILNGGVVA